MSGSDWSRRVRETCVGLWGGLRRGRERREVGRGFLREKWDSKVAFHDFY